MKHLFFISTLILLPIIHSDDPFAEFGNDFMGEDFENMDRQDRLHTNLEAGFDKWEDRCLRVGGQEALDQWLAAQENLVYCVMQNFNINSIQNEIEEKKRTGDLDLVFKKYCGVPVNKTRPCLVDFLKASRRCLKAEDQPSLDITLSMIDSAIQFMCHNSGDRIALFMSENGMGCLEDHQEDIMKCVNASVPELFDLRKQYSNIHLIVFSQENCRKGEALRKCVENSLLKCKDPTPSNVVNSLLLSMQKAATPCKGLIKAGYTSKASKSQFTSISLIITLIISFL